MKIIKCKSYDKLYKKSWGDSREHSYYPSNIKQDYQNMKLIIDGRPIPAKAEICPVCNGKGSFVNPSIDSQGLSSEDMQEEGFREDYFGGSYDQTCSSCNGNRVILVPRDETEMEDINQTLQDEADYRAEIDAERRMGA